jgi:hypothetical protein
MDLNDIDIFDTETGKKKFAELGTNPAPKNLKSFIYPEGKEWTAVYIDYYDGGEWFCETFPTKAQAVLYLTTDIDVDTIFTEFAPDRRPAPPVEDKPVPNPKRKVWLVSVHETTAATVYVEADTLQEARAAVMEDLDKDFHEQTCDWATRLVEGEVQDTSVYEGDPADKDEDYESDEEPDFTVKDGRLALPS